MDRSRLPNALAENELIAARRAIALGKLTAFDTECWRLAALVDQGVVTLADAVDALAETDHANNLGDTFGQDIVQSLMADAFRARFDGIEAKPPPARSGDGGMMDTPYVSNAQLDALALRTDARRGDSMLRAVLAFLGRFVAYPDGHAQVAHALWCVHAHLMDAWESTPRIAFLSAEPASGKTRALEITELLVPNPVSAVNVSPAYLFRKVGCEEGATILYDEIDTVFGPKAKENEEIRGLLNAGHRRGAVAGRCVVHGKTVTTEEIPAYSAVALAGLGWLPDTILSRSIIIRMRRRHLGEKVEPFRRRVHRVEGDKVRSQIELWKRTHKNKIKWPNLPTEIQDRDADVWEPLIAIADAVGGEWPERARVAAIALVAASKEVEPSLGVRLLSNLRTVFGDAEKMFTKAILMVLINLEESPWGDLRGKPLDERGLANRLRPYGIKSAQLRIGEVTGKGYRRSDLFDAWERYLPPSAGTETRETSETTEAPPHGVMDVTDVTDSEANGGDTERVELYGHCGVAQ